MTINNPKLISGIGDKKSNGGTQWYQQDRIYDDNVAISITTSFNPYYIEKMRGGNNLMEENTNLRIRKLTPKECFRLMGVKDKDISLIMEHQTNASAYHLAGDSIVCYGVLTAIFGELLGVDHKKLFNEKDWWIKE